MNANIGTLTPPSWMHPLKSHGRLLVTSSLIWSFSLILNIPLVFDVSLFFIHQYLFYGHCTIYNNFLPVNSVLGSSQTPKETFNAASYRRDKAKILERQKGFQTNHYNCCSASVKLLATYRSQDYLKKNYQVILLNDKIAIIVNLQYRKGFLYWCRKEKEWKYYIILSHSM